MSLNVEHLRRTADTLEQAILRLGEVAVEDVLYDLYRNAAIKSFELSLETSGKLLRKALKFYGGSPREVDKLVFNDVLRHAGKHGLLDVVAVERWIHYRANRNTTAHDYGAGFANETLKILPDFLQDARELAVTLQTFLIARSLMPQLNFSKLQLEPRHLQLLQSLLARYVPQAEVWAYGSRVSGNAHQGSDLDIVVRQPSDLMQVQPDLAELKEAVQASTLPILIDIHDWAQLPASFHTNIAAAFVVLQQPSQNI